MRKIVYEIHSIQEEETFWEITAVFSTVRNKLANNTMRSVDCQNHCKKQMELVRKNLSKINKLVQ